MMRRIRLCAAIVPALLLGMALMLWIPVSATAYSNGWGGGGSGCAPCHGPEPTVSLNVAITGPTTLTPGQTANYVLTIDPTNSGGAFSVDAINATLGAVDANTILLGTAVSHATANVGDWQYNFSVTAPATAGVVITLASTGMAFDGPNGDGPTDIWNNLGSGFSINVIPEPGTAALLGLGLGMLAIVGRRRS
jgi:hypothetical protein